MNRDAWRSLKRLSWNDAEREIRAFYDPQIERARAYAYKNAFASVFCALHDRFADLMTGETLHSIGVDAVKYANGIETPEELIIKLFDETGFDIRQRVEEQPFEYIPKGVR